MEEKTPASTSSDYDAMRDFWAMVSTIMGGTKAIRAAGQTYLPKFTHEALADYEVRRKNAKFTNIFGDIVETLSSKPFQNEATVDDAGDLEPYLENIDGQGNHIHVFLSKVFQDAVANAISWVLVDYTKNVPPGATRAQEMALGARPYWVHIPASRLLAVYSEAIGGVETIIHARIEECARSRDGWGEKETRRVRVLDRVVIRSESGEALSAEPPTWELFEERKSEDSQKTVWVSVDNGTFTVKAIPLFAMITGFRMGTSWVIRPPLASAAYLQIEHYQQESELKYARQMSAFPMLAGNGVEPATGDDGKAAPVPVGPMGVLYAPPNGDGQHGEWTFIEPQATSLEFLSREVDKTEAQLRELGRQPLTAQSGNITTITAAFAGDKAHTVIEAWAINAKDFAENCLKCSAEYMRLTIEPEVELNTDFSLSLKENDGTDTLDKARDRGDLSQETYWAELKRRGLLSPNFDAENERERIIAEMPGDPTDVELDAAMSGMDSQQGQSSPDTTADAVS